MVMHLQKHLKVLPAITLVRTTDDPEQAEPTKRFKNAVNEVMKKFVRTNVSQDA